MSTIPEFDVDIFSDEVLRDPFPHVRPHAGAGGAGRPSDREWRARGGAVCRSACSF